MKKYLVKSYPYQILKHKKLQQLKYFCTLPGVLDGKESSYNAGDRVQFLDWEYPVQKGMATHSSNLAWRIPWTEEPGRLYRSQNLKDLDMTE